MGLNDSGLSISLLIITWLSYLGSCLIQLPQDKVVFLDVGQGDSILLQSGTNQVLIDGGPGDMVLSRLGEEMPWFDHTVEVLILTHPQQDHLEGLLHVLTTYQVQLVILPQASIDSGLQAAWLSELQKQHIPYRFAWQGEVLSLANLTVQILAPFDSISARIATAQDINNASTTVRANIHGLSFYLSGDAEVPAEQLVLADTSPSVLNVDVVKAAHHGSKSSTSVELLQATTPAIVVISVGKNNKYGHPNQEVLERLRGIPTLRTDERGSIRFTYQQQHWLLSCQNSGMKST